MEGLYADDNATTEEIAAALKELPEALKPKKCSRSRRVECFG